MYKYVIKINKIFNRMMLAVYLLDIMIEFGYIVSIFNQFGWTRADQIFPIFYTITCGTMLAIDIVLVSKLLRKKNAYYAYVPLLLIYVVIQMMTVLLDIPCNIFFGGRWNTGYVYIILELFTIVIYSGRYFMLKTEKKYMTLYDNEEMSHDL